MFYFIGAATGPAAFLSAREVPVRTTGFWMVAESALPEFLAGAAGVTTGPLSVCGVRMAPALENPPFPAGCKGWG